MADRYRNFADLAAHEKEGLDFRIRLDERHGRAAVIAPHGGGIEPGTSELAEAIAGNDLSFYAFDGLKKRGNDVLHVTSTRFDEPLALALVAASPAVVAIHGELDCPDQVAFLGGLDKELGKRIQTGLEVAGFVVRIHDNPNLQGVDKRNICNRGPVPNWQSLYYPGEAALGFIALYEADHSPEWLTAAGKALSYLAKSRAGLTTLPADHWALIATAKLLPYCEKGDCAASREELVRHAIQVCESILRDQFKGSVAVGLDGGFDPTGRTAPTATRLEGLLAALDFLPEGELRNKVEAGMERGIGFLLRAQLVSGLETGGMPGAVVSRAMDSSEIRIDYVQHALCAWIRYQGWAEIGTDSQPRPAAALKNQPVRRR